MVPSPSRPWLSPVTESVVLPAALSGELTMGKFVHDENLKLFHKRLTETTDEKQRQVLHDLVAEHETKYR